MLDITFLEGFALIIIYFLAAIPFHKFGIKKAAVQQGFPSHQKDTSILSISSRPYKMFILSLFNVLKGFSLLWMIDFLFNWDVLFIISLAIILIGHSWSMFNMFKFPGQLGLVLLGIYAYLFPWMWLLYPLIYLFCLILFNSFHMAQLGTVLLAYLIFFYNGLDIYIMVSNSIILMIVFFRYFLPI